MKTKPRIHELGKVIVTVESHIIYQGKILMHKRAESKKKFPGYWIGPGGHVDEGEDVISAAIREIYEETGIKVPLKNIQLKAQGIHHHIDRNEVWVIFIFRAELDTTPQTHSTEEGETAWVPINKILKEPKVFPPFKYYFKHVLKNKPGILYNSSEWKNAKLHKVLSETIDKDT